MGARKDRRRKLARKAIRECLALENESAWPFDTDTTASLSNVEYRAVLDEIRAAKVTVTWDDR